MDMQAQRDQAYNERNRVVAALARFAITADQSYAWIGTHADDGAAWDPEWLNVVFVQLPTGQCSWHIHDSDLPLFSFLDHDDKPWDGHSTTEKYERVHKFATGGFFAKAKSRG